MTAGESVLQQGCLAVLALAACSPAAFAERVEIHPAELGGAFSEASDRYIVTSENVDDDFLIKVTQVGTANADQLVPVIFMFPGDSDWFDFVAYTAEALTQQDPRTPSMLIVGIDQPPDEALGEVSRDALHRHALSRAARVRRDLTPTIDVDEAARLQIGTSPGADNFLAFITEELEPLILERYPGDPNDRTFAGFALGGLFALYALFTEPDAFDRYVASMPTIYWDDHVLFDFESRFAERFPTASARLFVSTGGWEGAPGRFGVTALSERLQARRYPNLRYTVRLFEPGVNPIEAGIAYGLRDVFQ